MLGVCEIQSPEPALVGKVAILVSRDPLDHVGTTVLGRIRSFLMAILEAKKLGVKYGRLNRAFLWVYDFPLLKKVGEDCKSADGVSRAYESMHHPFTAPVPRDVNLLNLDPLKVLILSML